MTRYAHPILVSGGAGFFGSIFSACSAAVTESAPIDEDIVSPLPAVDERDLEASLRPKQLTEFVGQPKVREQLELGFLADDGVGTGHGDAGKVELGHQLVDRYLQHVRKLCNCHISHSPPPSQRGHLPHAAS